MDHRPFRVADEELHRAHKDDDDDKGNKNNIWTFNSNPSNITASPLQRLIG